MDMQDSWESIASPKDSEGRLQLPTSDQNAGVSSSVVLEGKYHLREEIGRGAMGTVFLAEDSTLKRTVAVKFLLPELADSTECSVRFRHEAVGMAAIRDNNVAQIYAFGKHGNIPYFVMEHLDGESVENIIDAHNRRGFFFPLQDAIDILVQSLSGLMAIHKAGVIHRDIKPANIMLTDDPLRAVIMDFGLVRNVKLDNEMRSLAGTPAYIAPELVEGRPGADASPAVDLYSMGTAAYELITGSLPFGGDTWVEILRKHLTEIPVFPSTRRPGLPEELDDIILRAMAKEPRERYSDCAEFIEDLLQLEVGPTTAESRRASLVPGARTVSQRRISKAPNSSLKKTRPDRRLSSAPRPTSARGRMVVVDSDPGFRKFVLKAAKSAVPDCRIKSASDGTMALKLVEDFEPHVLLVDLELQEINGLEVVATLRGDEKYNHLPIIVVAKKGSQKEASILSGLRVDNFLTKPVDQDELASILRRFLERRINLTTRSSMPPPPK
jgi:serine/threonine-protein kinase